MDERLEFQKILDACDIDEEVQCVTRYTSKDMEPRVEVITDRVAYDMGIEPIVDNKLTGDMTSLREYIKGCQI